MKAKVLLGINIVFCVLFFVFRHLEFEALSLFARCLIICMFTTLYFVRGKFKSKYFSIFLILFAFSELLSLFSFWISPNIDYLLGNFIYIVAYLFLLLEITKDLNLGELYKNFSVHLVVLTLLNMYLIYVLITIVSPVLAGFELAVEFIYNIVTLLVLSFSLIYYLQKDTKKSLLLFFGSLCLVFSEVLQIAYFYIIETKTLGISYSALLILAFYFYYLQSVTETESVKEAEAIA